MSDSGAQKGPRRHEGPHSHQEHRSHGGHPSREEDHPGNGHAKGAPRRQDTPQAVQANFQPSRWPGLIWAVPVAALGIVAWLGISALLSSGPTVIVSFPVTGGLKAGSTQVVYRGFNVGEVHSVGIAKTLDHMEVELDLDSTMKGHLGPGTQYWIGGSSVDLTDLTSVKNILSGPFIGVAPKPGRTVSKATGLSEPPVLKDDPPGTVYTLTSATTAHLSAGSPIYFNDYKVGEIRGLKMSKDGRQFQIYAFIDRGRENLVRNTSRFWDAGAIRFVPGGPGPAVQLQSIPALIMGSVAFETPDYPAGIQAKPGASFPLYSSETVARAAPGPDSVPYRVIFSGGPNGLSQGDPVQLEGAPAGEVTQVAVNYDPRGGTVRTTVDLVLNPSRIGLEGGAWNPSNPAPQMNAMLDRLLQQGLRAELGSSVPVIGGREVQLTRVDGQPAARLGPGRPPVIPSFDAGGGFQDVLGQVNAILAKIRALPLGQIADNIRQTTAGLAKASRSPQTAQALQQLKDAVGHIDDITRQADLQLPGVFADLRRSAAEAQSALARAQGILGAPAGANPGLQSGDLPQTLYEITRAAQSLRELTDLLDGQPNALIFGRKGKP